MFPRAGSPSSKPHIVLLCLEGGPSGGLADGLQAAFTSQGERAPNSGGVKPPSSLLFF